MHKLLIIDGMNLLFRMFFGIPASLKNTRGEEIKGVIGFLGGMKKYCKIFAPDKLIAVFDSETGLTDKTAIDAEYKQNRIDYSDVPEELNPFSQLKYIYQVLDYLTIPYVEVMDYEADDYIASVCEKYKADHSCLIVSTDKDFLQLVDENVNLYNPTREILYTPELVYEKFNIYPHQMVDYKILVGDKSDNIKGIRTIGPKTAAKILKAGSLAEIIKNENAINGKLYNKIMENKLVVVKNQLLITMNRNINLKINITAIRADRDMNRKTRELLRECGVD